MIRQTKNYLVGALSGVTLIGIAIAAFVVIVSAQVFHEWPAADTGATASESGVAPAKVAASPTGDEATATTGVDPALRAVGRKAAAATTRTGRPASDGASATADVGGPATVVESPSSSAGEESSGGDPGSSASQPSSPAPSSSGAGSPSNPGSSGTTSDNNTATAASSGSGIGSNGGATGSSGSNGSGGSPPAPGAGTTVETPVTAVKVPPVSEAVNETVHGVDEAALGGTLEKAGVTEVTESVVTGVAGPETPVGKTVEGAAEAVGGLLGGN